LENTRGFGLDMKNFFLENRGIKTLKVEDIGYNVENKKIAQGTLWALGFKMFCIFILLLGNKGHWETW